MKSTTSPLSRSIVGICGVAVGSYCALAAYQNGTTLAHGNIGTAFGIAFAAVVIGSWFLLHLGGALALTAYALAFAFVVANAVMFTATVRTEHVNDKTMTIDAYNRAEETRATAKADLAAAKTSDLWELTHGCTTATRERSIAFCNSVSAAQGRLSRAEDVLQSGRPAESDAGAAVLAWVIQGDEKKVARGLPVFLAVVLEIAASVFLKIALKAPAKRPRQDALSKQFAAWQRASRRQPREIPTLRVIEPDKPKAIAPPKEAPLPPKKKSRKKVSV